MAVEAPGVDSGVTAATAGAEIRWLSGRFLNTSGLVGGFSARSVGVEPDFAVTSHRTPPELCSAAAEPDVDYEGLPQGVSTTTHMLAGAVAGIMEHCLMYPIDCVKVSKNEDIIITMKLSYPTKLDKHGCLYF
jgi:solute carrier family 25 iron transporter 28/37